MKTRDESNLTAETPIADQLSPEDYARAILNILEDFSVEKVRLEETQRAMLNLLEDFDIERSRTEEKNKELRNSLESLRLAKEATEYAYREIEAFSYSVSHDLRAPLRAIDGFSKMLVASHSGQLDEEGRRKLNIIRYNSQAMGQLIDDLLTFSRLSRKEMTSITLDMDSLVTSSWKELTMMVPENKTKFVSGKLPSCIGDHNLVKQVISNLLSNAIKFTRPIESPIIEVGAYKENDENVYFIKDNGVGFNMKYYDKIFGVFQRLHSSEEFEGTGVGLAIVERIVHRHGGRVWAEGEVGEGATFYFTLTKQE